MKPKSYGLYFSLSNACVCIRFVLEARNENRGHDILGSKMHAGGELSRTQRFAFALSSPNTAEGPCDRNLKTLEFRWTSETPPAFSPCLAKRHFQGRVWVWVCVCVCVCVCVLCVCVCVYSEPPSTRNFIRPHSFLQPLPSIELQSPGPPAEPRNPETRKVHPKVQKIPFDPPEKGPQKSIKMCEKPALGN